MRDFLFSRTDQPTMLEFNKRFGGITTVLNTLGNEYVWAKQTAKYVYDSVASVTGNDACVYNSNYDSVFYVGDSFEQVASGNYEIWTIKPISESDAARLNGKYFIATNSPKVSSSDIYFVPENTVWLMWDSSYGYSTNGWLQRYVNPHSELGPVISYLNSPDPNAYPPVLGTEYVMGEPVYTAVKIATVLFESVTVNYYDNVSLNKTTGVVYPVGDMQSVSATNNTKTNFSVLSGKYVLWENKLHLCKPNDPYYVTEDSKYNFYLNLWEVSAVAQEITDEYVYTALGQLGNKMQIATGSYVGTGTYGASNPNSITFDFMPKIVLLAGQVVDGVLYPLFGNVDITTGVFVMYPHLLSSTFAVRSGFLNGNNATANVFAKKEGNTIYWYVTSSAGHQANTSGTKYCYIAIG